MNGSGALLLLFGAAAVLANLPFLSRRFLVAIPFRRSGKPVWAVLLEWLLCLSLAIGLAWILERQQGPVQKQHWQFYVSIVCVFAVLGTPGFTWRFLWQPPRRR